MIKRNIRYVFFLFLFLSLFFTTCSAGLEYEYLFERIGYINETYPPDTPKGLTAVAITGSTIMVSWKSVSRAYRYYVYRSTNPSGEYITVYRGYYYEGNSFLDTNRSSNTTYYYKVSADSWYGLESSLSDFVHVRILP